MGAPPFELDCTRSLPRLRELERRYRAEADELQRGVVDATEDLDRWLFVQRLLRPDGPVLAVRRLCEALQASVEEMERDLVEIRSAIVGLCDEIALLEDAVARRAEAACDRVSLPLDAFGRGAVGDLHASFRTGSLPWGITSLGREARGADTEPAFF